MNNLKEDLQKRINSGDVVPKKLKQEIKKGYDLIMLNGSDGAGKTTLAKSLEITDNFEEIRPRASKFEITKKFNGKYFDYLEEKLKANKDYFEALLYTSQELEKGKKIIWDRSPLGALVFGDDPEKSLTLNDVFKFLKEQNPGTKILNVIIKINDKQLIYAMKHRIETGNKISFSDIPVIEDALDNLENNNLSKGTKDFINAFENNKHHVDPIKTLICKGKTKEIKAWESLGVLKEIIKGG